jgi:rSAM/selenodomain-associated transferase 1
VVFCKYPVPGRVKTRLAASIGQEVAARYARRFIEETVSRAVGTGLPVDVHFAPVEHGPAFRDWLGPDHVYAPQSGGDLGERMHRAFVEAFSRGASRVVLTGTDAPDRPDRFLTLALDSLEDHAVAIGPALDGGYHLIAMRRDAFAREAFQGISWSTSLVLGQTLTAIRAAGRTVHLLPAWPDIDDEYALAAYLRRQPGAALQS